MIAPDDLALKAMLVLDEGEKDYLYDDATGHRLSRGSTIIGHPTTGIGFDFDAQGLCEAAIHEQYVFDVTQVIHEVSQSLPWSMRVDDTSARVLVNIAFNAGVNGLLGFHKMLGYLQKGDKANAAAEVVKSQLAPARAKRLAALLEG